MLNIILLSVLLASATAKPRSKGEPLQVSLQAQSGSAFQYNSHAQPSPSPSVVPQPQGGAIFKYDPIKQELTQINPAGLVTGQQPFQFQPIPQPGGQESEIIPSAVPVPVPIPQPNYQTQHIPQGFPIHSQSPGNMQGTPQVNPVQSIATISQTLLTPENIVRQIPPSNSLTPQSEIVRRLIGNPPGGALLVGTNPPIFPIEKRLISNYTTIRANVVDRFRCADTQPGYVGYGYYADVDNECQIFHVCLPWRELFPLTFQSDVTHQFSFICPNQTVFSQDALTCTYRSEAINCQDSPMLYWMNDNFFRTVPNENGFGTKYAEVNTPL